MFELHDRLLNRDAAYADVFDDLVAVGAVTGAQLAGQHQVDDVGNHLALLFDSL